MVTLVTLYASQVTLYTIVKLSTLYIIVKLITQYSQVHQSILRST